MIKFLLGCAVGFIFGFVLAILFFLNAYFKINFDPSHITNTIIAAATTVATWIHISSVNQQKKNRVWDMNKSILLDFSFSLSKLISYYDYYINKTSGDSDEFAYNVNIKNKQSNDFIIEFNGKKNYFFNVYINLLDSDFKESIIKIKSIEENTVTYFNYGDLSAVECYKESRRNYIALKECLDLYILKMSNA